MTIKIPDLYWLGIFLINFSPRSLEACVKLGLDPKDLFFVEFNEYKMSNPEIFALNKDIQKIRWNHMNQLKEKYISNLIKVF